MDINEKLKFSWGHIVAFVALIIISYFSFLGLTYFTDGNFLVAGIGVAVTDIVIFFVFIGAQMLKATDHRFKTRIHFERCLVCAAPFILIAMLMPGFHFWTVFSGRDAIEEKFSDGITLSNEMFEVYENYCDERIRAFSEKMRNDADSAAVPLNPVHFDNEVLALKLQLNDNNYLALKRAAASWLETASDATVWNVFMIGNIRTIISAIDGWHERLTEFSGKILSDESDETMAFDSDSAYLNAIHDKLVGISGIYTKVKFPNHYAILMLLVCYVFLMFPYMVQERNTRSVYFLFPGKKAKTGIVPNMKSAYADKVPDENRDITTDRSTTEDVKDKTIGSEETSEYESFTM